MFIFLFFLILISLIIYRAPCLFTANSFRSFFNETAFYVFSSKNNFLDSIFYVYPYASYFELWTNISGKFASFFPNYSSLVDVYFALIIKLIIFLYIFYSNSTLFYNVKYKILAIENDVPNYVKTNRLLLGKCPITDTGSGLNWDGYDIIGSLSRIVNLEL